MVLTEVRGGRRSAPAPEPRVPGRAAPHAGMCPPPEAGDADGNENQVRDPSLPDRREELGLGQRLAALHEGVVQEDDPEPGDESAELALATRVEPDRYTNQA